MIFFGGDLVGEGDKGGGELKGCNPPNPSDPLDTLPFLDVECGGCEEGCVRGGDGVEGFDWDVSRSASYLFGGWSSVLLDGCFRVASNKNQWFALRL